MTSLAREPLHTSDTLVARANGEQRLLLSGVDWERYLAIGRCFVDQPGLRLTYDQGRLEFMTTSPKHEIYKKHLARFIEIMAEELNRPFATAGSMTFESEAQGKGLEADDCFWFEHEVAMRGKLTWNAATDPPPDLGLEIEVSRSALNRMGIYAALRVGEVWRFDGQALKVHWLQADGTYRQESASRIFPGVPLEELVSFLNQAQTTDVLSVIRAFREWVRKLGAPPGPT